MIGLWITAGLVVAFIIGGIIVATIRDRAHESAWRREAGQAAPQRGRHRALKPLPAVIPRTPTEHAPPWDPAPVLEPATLLAAPVADAPADVIIASTVVAPPLPGTLIPPVAELLGYASVDAAVDAFAAEWHSVESIFNGRHVREVRALTDGAS